MSSTKWGSLRQQAEDSTKALPKGRYNVEVTKAEAVKASTGADMIKATLTVTDGPHKGRNLWTNFVLSPEKPFAMNLFFKNMNGFGLNGDFFAQLEQTGAPIEQDLVTIANTLIGRRASGDVDIRMFKEQERNEIGNFTSVAGDDPLGGGVIGPVVPVVSGSTSSSVPPVPNISTPSTPSTPPTSIAPATPVVGDGPTINATPSAPPDIVF